MPDSKTLPAHVPCWDKVSAMQEQAQQRRSKMLRAAAEQDAAAHRPIKPRQKGVLPNEHYPLTDIAKIADNLGAHA